MEKRIVEINGVKMEVDLRTATRVEEYKIGTRVKVLIKQYTDTYKSHFGMIVGFDDFKKKPTIIVAYIDQSTWSEPLKMAYIYDGAEVDIAPQDNGDIGVVQSDVIEQFDRQIVKLGQEINEVKNKKEYFLRMFGHHFGPQASAEGDAG